MSTSFDRVIVVTGAASGIGAAIARRVAAPGVGLLLHTRRNTTGLKAVTDEAERRGARVEAVVGDLSNAALPTDIVVKARTAFGRVDQIVSNAGQASRSRFGALTPVELDLAFATMPVAFMRMIDAAFSDLENSAWGRVVVVSSFVAHRFGTADLLFPATSAAKAALEALAKALAFQLAPTRTTVNCIAPGFTRKDGAGHSATPPEANSAAAEATPSGRLAVPDDIAATATFLLSREAAHITGQVIHVDGGLTLA